jgi:ATP phosphoribosyltransferase
MQPQEWIKHVLFRTPLDGSERFSLEERAAARKKAEQGPDFFQTIGFVSDLGYGRVDVRWEIPEAWAEKGFAGFKGRDSETWQTEEEAIKRLESIFSDPVFYISSDYPNMTHRELSRHMNTKYLGKKKRGDFSYSAIRVFPLKTTEMAIKLGLADIVVDSVSSGESMRKNNLVAIGEPLLRNSTAGIYGCLAYDFDEKSTQRIMEFKERLEKAAKDYAKLYKDSIWHPSHQEGAK